jgi:hypothetical protein
MKVLKKTKDGIAITKPLVDLARAYDVELYFNEVDRILRIHSDHSENAFLEYKVDFNAIYMKTFVAVFDYTHEMQHVENIPQQMRTRGDYMALFIAVQKAFKGGSDDK